MGLSYNADSRRRNLQTLGPVLARVLRHDVGDWCQLGRASGIKPGMATVEIIHMFWTRSTSTEYGKMALPM